MTQSLKIRVKDKAKALDKLDTWKQWFNGAKHFFTVQTLPPHRKNDR